MRDVVAVAVVNSLHYLDEDFTGIVFWKIAIVFKTIEQFASLA